MRKVCTRCNVCKPLERFCVRARWEDGSPRWWHSHCRECVAEANRKWRQAVGEDRERIRERQRAWVRNLDAESAATRRDQQREWYRRRHAVPESRYRVRHDAGPAHQTVAAAPFAAWIGRLMDELQITKTDVGLRTGVGLRTIRAVMNGSRDTVELGTVEAAVIKEGNYTLRDVYPDLYSEHA